MTADDELQAAIDEARHMVSAELKLSALERLRKSVLSERQVLRVLTIMAIVVGVVGIGLSIYSLGLASDANAALDEFKATRTEAREVACQQFNEQQARSRAAEKLQLRTVISPRTRTPEEQAQLDETLKRHDAAMDEAYPDRDCSAEGIEAYYKEGTGT